MTLIWLVGPNHIVFVVGNSFFLPARALLLSLGPRNSWSWTSEDGGGQEYPAGRTQLKENQIETVHVYCMHLLKANG